MTTLVVVRHAEAHYRALDGSYLPDGGLTGRGMAQAHALADVFRHLRPDLVLTSPALRARQTAALAELDATPCDDLIEWRYEPYEQALAAGRAEADDPWWIWEQATRHRSSAPETLDELTQRIDRVIADLTAVPAMSQFSSPTGIS
jgi:broad specificity phosphatase PhoE